MKFLVSLLISSISVVVAAYLTPNVELDGYQTAIIVALILGLINTFIKPAVKILTLPINVLTLGIFSLVLNGVFILLISNFVSGFNVDSFFWAMIYSIALSVVASILSTFIK